ncbi:MAG: phage tail protein [Nanoarchaeota archaeon]|nr:phage tail protein [Nanoarchaeota archaeon]
MAKQSFWSDPVLEPKRQYRWVMFIGGIPQWVIKKTAKPNFKVTESVHKYINHTFHYPGRVEWQPIEVILVDPIAPDASRTIMNIIKAAGYHFPVDASDTSTMSKAKATAALGNVVIEQLDAEGNAVDQWQLINAWVSNVNMGQLDYEGDNMVDITLTITYDYAEMTLPGALSGIDSADS